MLNRPGALRILLAATIIAGCEARPTFTTGYAVPSAVAPPRPVESRLAVTRFAEGRPPREYHTWSRQYLTYIPLILYVSVPLERVDENVDALSKDIERYGSPEHLPIAPPFETYAYPVSIPRAIAADLATTGLFSSVDYIGDGDTSHYRYVLNGEVRASPLRSTFSSFGLGVVGMMLWYLPIPAQKTTADVTVDLTLVDTRSGNVIWRDTLSQEVSRVATIYNDPIVYGTAGMFSFSLLRLRPSVTTVDRDSLFSWHFEALRRAMQAAKPSLAEALAAG